MLLLHVQSHLTLTKPNLSWQKAMIWSN